MTKALNETGLGQGMGRANAAKEQLPKKGRVHVSAALSKGLLKGDYIKQIGRLAHRGQERRCSASRIMNTRRTAANRISTMPPAMARRSEMVRPCSPS